MHPFWRAITFSWVLERWCVFLMREASTLMLRIVSQSHDEEDWGSLRSNVVHDDGDAKTMFAAKNVLEESRLSRALEHSQRR
jgi:hypothetical protein